MTLGREMKTGDTETDKFNADTRLVIEQRERNRYTVGARLTREYSQNALTKDQYVLDGSTVASATGNGTVSSVRGLSRTSSKAWICAVRSASARVTSFATTRTCACHWKPA